MPLHEDARLCNAHKRDGAICTNMAVTGMTKCRMHGGKSLRGAALPQYKSGRYSKSLPMQLAQRYEEARSNPRLLSLDDDIALTEARLAQLLEQVDTGESGARWQALREALEAFSAAMGVGDMAGMAAHFAELRRLVEAGAAQVGVWREVYEVVETRQKLVPAQVKTLQTLQQMLTVQQHMLMVGALTDAVVRAVQKHADVQTGRKILMDMQTDFTKLSTLEEGR